MTTVKRKIAVSFQPDFIWFMSRHQVLPPARSLRGAQSPWGRALSPGMSLYTQAFADYLWCLLESFWLNKMSLSAGGAFPKQYIKLAVISRSFYCLPRAILAQDSLAWRAPRMHSHHPCAPATHFLQGPTSSGAESHAPGDGCFVSSAPYSLSFPVISVGAPDGQKKQSL